MTDIFIDINADVGEGLNNEIDIMPYLSSCNIACGGHTGDVSTMLPVVKLAKKHNVKIGAHPSYPDIANFGRLPMQISSNDLYESLKAQIHQLNTILKQEGIKLHHIKPHGALYNRAVKDKNIANVIIDVIATNFKTVKLYAPNNSVVANLADQSGIEVIFEAFADRNYNKNLSLVSRQKSNAVITKKEAVFSHIFYMIKHAIVKTINDVEMPIYASTFCVHGDTKNAIEILKYLSKELPKHKIHIQ